MTDPHGPHEEFSQRIADKEARKVKAREGKDKGVWFGLGAMGTVGWSVAVPTIAGALLGRWLDGRLAHGAVSWTLMLLLIGLGIGCLNAYHWVHRESKKIGRDEHDD